MKAGSRNSTTGRTPRSRPQRDRRLAQVMRALSEAVELEPFLRTVLAAAQEITESEAALLMEFDRQQQSLLLRAASPGYQAARPGTLTSLDNSAAGRAVTERRPIRIPDVKGAAAGLRAADRRLTSHTRSILAVPLRSGEVTLGALLAVNKDGVDYTEEDTAILETLAAPAALALQNAALQSRINADLSELSDLDRLKTDFIAITSHELRTPLGVILGHATFLHELLDEKYREQLDVIIRNASRLKDIVDSLAGMDNFTTGGARLRQAVFSANDLVTEVMASAADFAAQRGISMKVESVPKDLSIEADRTKISIALDNLVRNAIAFTDAGGNVLVRSESVPGHVRISVIDDGIGIPSKDLPRVFERFFQVESHLTRHHSGMGLGLALTKVMIEMHGGRIWVDSAEGRGSTFSFLLPSKVAQPGLTPGSAG